MTLDPRLSGELLPNSARQRRAALIDERRLAVKHAPNSAAAEHNLASALADDGRWAESEVHVRKAFDKGGKAPETWLAYSRCLLARGAFPEAVQALHHALNLNPELVDAHTDLAQLLWMQTGDADQALSTIAQASLRAPGNADLAVARAQAMEHMGREADARSLWRELSKRFADNVAIAVGASYAAAKADLPDDALVNAMRAHALLSDHPVVAACLISALLSAGAADRAEPLAQSLVNARPSDQHAIALLATCWRLLADPRYQAVYDYEAFVRRYTLECPPGWPTLDAYLSDLRAALRGAHLLKTHPFNQSVRHGTQLPDVLRLEHAAARALPAALTAPVKQYLNDIGQGPDPLRARALGGAGCRGLWSIRMQAGGAHVSHVHPDGWISSACYIETPPTLRASEGRIHFGKPGIPTRPALEHEFEIAPEVGMLVLFPSYMWHGVHAYAGEGARMTIAFDLEPSHDVEF